MFTGVGIFANLKSGSLSGMIRGFWQRLQRGLNSFGGVLGSGLHFCGLGTGTRTLAWGRTQHPCFCNSSLLFLYCFVGFYLWRHHSLCSFCVGQGFLSLLEVGGLQPAISGVLCQSLHLHLWHICGDRWAPRPAFRHLGSAFMYLALGD